MTKKKKTEKRRIQIEDKRYRSADSEPEVQDAPVAEPEQAMDEKLIEFTEPPAGTPSATAKAAAAAYDTAGKSAQAEPDLKAALEDPMEQVKALEDQILRKEAELRNYRKRVQQDMSDARRFAVEGLLSDLFPAFDGLAQAAQSMKNIADGENPLLDGVRRTVRSLEGALGKHGIEKINDAPVPFDPLLHQPLNVEESSDVEEDTVAEIYVEGYRMGEVVLKPAMVRVVKPE